MEDIYLSKSRYCRAVQCKKMLWLDMNKPEEKGEADNQFILDNGTEVGNIAKDLFGLHFDVEYNSDKSIMIADTEILMGKTNRVITEASFSYNNNFCSVDILKNDKDGLEIYEVKSSSKLKPQHLEDVSFQVYVLLKLGYNIKSANLIHLNKEYKKDGEIDLNGLFKIENITEEVLKKQEEVENNIKEISKYINENKEEPGDSFGGGCTQPYKCEYSEYCKKDLPKNNVFDIADMTMKEKSKLYFEGKVTFKDLLTENLDEKYMQQIEIGLSGETIINKKEIRNYMKKLTYPIYFLDFETYMQAIPTFDGVKVYRQIPFQYSLHYIEKEGGELKHKEFLAKEGTDPRRAIAEQLIKDIPKDVCVLAYYMSFEKTRISELAEEFKDLRKGLMNIHDNIVDLIVPFKNRWYYNKEMEGEATIKKVLPALFPEDPELNYKNLPVVHNGGEAASTFATLPEKTEEEKKFIREGLLKYCYLDTLAMVKIWEKLKEI